MVNRNGDMDGFLVGTESGKIYKLLLHAYYFLIKQ
jgi:hypothetical protein